ncbi:DUF1580 domain-containing protein [Singulisphaera sp. PoT]|uniref:DUF1580 domain-containing protein n=1 Tax=Singulisphaera sp. PoT TaxID=3411797 RepID=UPI003BF53291
MAIDIATEKLITPVEYTKLRPPGRGGRPMHVSTFFRHQSPGVKGIRLETVKIGGNVFTSVEAAGRFFRRLTEARSNAPGQRDHAEYRPLETVSHSTPITSPARTSAQRHRAHQAAERELDRMLGPGGRN